MPRGCNGAISPQYPPKIECLGSEMLYGEIYGETARGGIRGDRGIYATLFVAEAMRNRCSTAQLSCVYCSAKMKRSFCHFLMADIIIFFFYETQMNDYSITVNFLTITKSAHRCWWVNVLAVTLHDGIAKERARGFSLAAFDTRF